MRARLEALRLLGAELTKLSDHLQRQESRYLQKEAELLQLRTARDQLFWDREGMVLDLQVRGKGWVGGCWVNESG